MVSAMKSLDEHSADTNLLEINEAGSDGNSDAIFDYECSSTSEIQIQNFEMEVLKFLAEGNNSLSSLHRCPRIMKVFFLKKQYSTSIFCSRGKIV